MAKERKKSGTTPEQNAARRQAKAGDAAAYHAARRERENARAQRLGRELPHPKS